MANSLNSEQRQDLREVLDHEGIKALLVLAESLVEDQERQVLTRILTQETEKDIVYGKARAEGARKLFTLLKGELQTLKRSSN